MVNVTPVSKATALRKAIVRKPVAALGIKPIAKPKPNIGSAPLPKTAKPVVDPDAAINKYLTNDVTYQQQTAAINKALGDYTANAANARTQYNNQYAQNVYDLDTEKTQALSDQQNDFAARGFLRSGGNAVATSDNLNKYASRQSTMDMTRGSFLQNNESDVANFGSSQALAVQQARQDAINRRALGLLGGK